jgi:transposase-like protein
MTKHKTEDYKNSAVKYYLNNEKGDGYKKTCKIFDCKKSSLKRWIHKYKTSKNIFIHLRDINTHLYNNHINE